MTGFFTRSSRSIRRSPSRSYSMPASAVSKTLNWLMSVPATKALPPAPRRTNTRISSSASTSSQAWSRRSYIVQVMALRAWGRLKVRVSTGPSRVTRTSSSATGSGSSAWCELDAPSGG